MEYNRYFVQTFDHAMERVQECEKDIATALFLETETEAMDMACLRIFGHWFAHSVMLERVYETLAWVAAYVIEQAPLLYIQVHPDATICGRMGKEITIGMMARLHPYYVEGDEHGNT
jgi:hypothetical protein